MTTSSRPVGHITVLLLLVIVLSALLAACRPLDQSPQIDDAEAAVRKPSSLAILHTNDTWGYYDPCG